MWISSTNSREPCFGTVLHIHHLSRYPFQKARSETMTLRVSECFLCFIRFRQF